MSVPSPIIEITDLKKKYGSVEALCGLDLSVPRGSICGFLGRNGAGKTTTMKTLMGLVHPSAGQVKVFGLSSPDRDGGVTIRRRAAFVSEDKDLPGHMTLRQSIATTRALFPEWNEELCQRLMERFGVSEDCQPGSLSRGMRTRAALAVTLPRGAELLILDEPTDGLDPAMKEEVLQILVGLTADSETTIFFASHQLAEVEQIADHVCIIDKGKSVVAGPIDELKGDFRRVNLVFGDDDSVPEFADAGIIRLEREGRFVSILARDADAILDRVRSQAPLSVDVVPVSLKEIFLETTRSQG